jgi:hypothetical protein
VTFDSCRPHVGEEGIVGVAHPEPAVKRGAGVRTDRMHRAASASAQPESQRDRRAPVPAADLDDGDRRDPRRVTARCFVQRPRLVVAEPAIDPAQSARQPSR